MISKVDLVQTLFESAFLHTSPPEHAQLIFRAALDVQSFFLKDFLLLHVLILPYSNLAYILFSEA